MSIRTKAFVALLLVSAFWGSAGVVAKILIRELHPYVVLFYRFGVAAIVLLPLFMKAKKPAHMWRVLIPFSLLVAGNAIFFYIGISRTTVSSSAIIGATVPLVTAVLSHLFIKERTSKEKFLGIIIGLIGAMFITLLPFWGEGKLLGGDVIGNLFLIAGIVCWALYVVGSRYFLTNDTYSPLVMVEINFLTLAVVSFLLAVFTGQVFYSPKILNSTYLFVLLYSTALVTVGAFGLFQWALKYISAATASLKDYIQLIVGVVLSLVILKETVNTSFVIGSLIVILGIGIATGRPILSKVMQRLTPVK